MAESEKTASEPRQPFAPGPVEPVGGGGWTRPLLTGCAVLLVLLGLALAIFAWKARDVLRWSLDRYESAIFEKLPEDIDLAETERLRRAFAALDRAVSENSIDPAALTEMQSRLLEVGRKVEDLRVEDVRALSEALEKAAGVEAPATAPPLEGAAPVQRSAALA